MGYSTVENRRHEEWDEIEKKNTGGELEESCRVPGDLRKVIEKRNHKKWGGESIERNKRHMDMNGKEVRNACIFFEHFTAYDILWIHLVFMTKIISSKENTHQLKTNIFYFSVLKIEKR